MAGGKEEFGRLREVGMLEWIYHKAENPLRQCCTGVFGGYTTYSSCKACTGEQSTNTTEKLHCWQRDGKRCCYRTELKILMCMTSLGKNRDQVAPLYQDILKCMQ